MEHAKKFCRSAAIVGTLFVLSVMAQAQTLTVLHAFTGGSDGASPGGTGVTIDRAGNLYGGAGFGGLSGPQCYSAGTCGTIFKLARRGSSWTFDLLYSFHGPDGATPNAPLVFGPDGALYGSTFFGANSGCYNGCGNVFRLQPPPTFCPSVQCPWVQTVLHNFVGQTDGGQPAYGAMTFDASGNLYGTASSKGENDCGTIFELAPNGSQWTFNVLWTFTGHADGCESWSGVTFDQAGNLYGTTTEGGQLPTNNGTAFELSPYSQGWSLTPLYQFVIGSDGDDSLGNVVFDSSGNLFATNQYGGPGGEGGIFELSPRDGSWNLTLLHSYYGERAGPQGPLLRDSAGNLYGTSLETGQYNWGSIFKLTPSGSGYTYTDLYDFTGGSDGGWPGAQIVMDTSGNLYGEAEIGGITGGDLCGNYGCGTVWELTP